MNHQLQEAVSKVRTTMEDGNTSGGPEKGCVYIILIISIGDHNLIKRSEYKNITLFWMLPLYFFYYLFLLFVYVEFE